MIMGATLSLAVGSLPALVAATGVYDVDNRGLFELDGNTAQDAQVAPPYDWASLFGATGANVPPAARALPVGTQTTVGGKSYTLINSLFLNDTTAPDLAFIGGGSKDINDPQGNWQCTVKPVTPKDEIDNSYAALWRDDGAPSHTIMYMALERGIVNGTSNASFWLLQSPISCPSAGGTFTGHHKNGDLLFFATFNGGGGTATIDVHSWTGGDGAAGHLSPTEATGQACSVSSASPCGMVNSGSIQTPWAPHNSDGTAIQQNGFFEMGVDLTSFFGGLNPQNPVAPCFNGFMDDTRSSGDQGNAINSELHDFMLSGFSNCGHISISKSTTTPVVNATDNISYGLTVTNDGVGPAGGVTVSDSIPAPDGTDWTLAQGSPSQGSCTLGAPAGTPRTQALSCGLGDIAQGGGATINFNSPTTPASCGTLANVASAGWDGNTSPSNEADITVNCPSLSLQKAAAKATVSAGDHIGYTITVSNAGPGDAYNTAVSDPIPAPAGTSWTVASVSQGSCDPLPAASGAPLTQVLTCNLGTLAAGHSAVITLISATTSASCGTLDNTAGASDSNGGGTPTASAGITVNCPAIHIVKTADSATVNEGGPIGFGITFWNSGPGTAYGVHVNDTLPTNTGAYTIDGGSAQAFCSINAGALTCDEPSLAPSTQAAGQTVHISTATTSSSCPSVSNTAAVTTTNDGSDRSTADVTVNCPQLALTKTADHTTAVTAGTPIGFTITLNNTGLGSATGVLLTDPLPAVPTSNGALWQIDGTPTLTGSGLSGLSCLVSTAAPQVLTCGMGVTAPLDAFTLLPGAGISVHITHATDGSSPGTYPNTASAASTNTSVQPASATEIVQAPVTTAVQAATTVLPAQTGDWNLLLMALGAPFILAGVLLLVISRRREEDGV